jgi:hypothetical protein
MIFHQFRAASFWQKYLLLVGTASAKMSQTATCDGTKNTKIGFRTCWKRFQSAPKLNLF